MLNKNEFINSQLHNNNVLDDMIQSANEVLNALLRLRKHQILVNAHETSPMEQYSVNKIYHFIYHYVFLTVYYSLIMHLMVNLLEKQIQVSRNLQ